MTVSDEQTAAALTTDEAAGRSREDAGALQTVWVGTGGPDAALQAVRVEPARKPLQLAVAQEAVALEEPEERRGEWMAEKLEKQN